MKKPQKKFNYVELSLKYWPTDEGKSKRTTVDIQEDLWLDALEGDGMAIELLMSRLMKKHIIEVGEQLEKQTRQSGEEQEADRKEALK